MIPQDTQPAHGFALALCAPGRSASIDAVDDVYGWLIGSWEMDVMHYLKDVRAERRRGEIHFAWVLEGLAVQDVWIMPPRREPGAPVYSPGGASAVADKMYGTTLRVWDPALRAWRITYLNPATGQRDELVGRRAGAEVVQIGTHANGTPIRWSFTDITPDSFRWTGVALAPDGITWTLEAEFQARRRLR
jgi:hypothetical protein